MSIQAEITLGTLDPELCEGTWQDIYEAFMEATTITMPIALNTVNYGNTPPGPDDLTKPWIRYNDSGYPDETYVYNGQWLAKHPLPPGLIMMYMGTAASIATLDGGENTAVGADQITGPFWEIVTELNGRFPLGVSEDYALNATGGAATHTLTVAEMPEHSHTTELWDGAVASGTNPQAYIGTTKRADYPTSEVGEGDPHNNMPPYRALFFIKRTQRLYRRI